MIVVRGYALNKWLILIANKVITILNTGFIFAGFFFRPWHVDWKRMRRNTTIVRSSGTYLFSQVINHLEFQICIQHFILVQSVINIVQFNQLSVQNFHRMATPSWIASLVSHMLVIRTRLLSVLPHNKWPGTD